MIKSYKMKIADVERELELFPVNENLYIAAFIMLGDTELTVAAARELLKKAPEYDIIVTPECKSIPLAHEMARQSGNGKYVTARKGLKVYMKNAIKTEVNSITTDKIQELYLGEGDVEEIKGKKVLLVDDVISTGGSLASLEQIVNKAGGNIVAKMAVLAEGDASERDDIIYLKKLPLFDANGEEI